MKTRPGSSGLFALLLLGQGAWACATCGLSQSFSPKMLLISSGFVILPLIFAGLIGWKTFKDDEKMRRFRRREEP